MSFECLRSPVKQKINLKPFLQAVCQWHITFDFSEAKEVNSLTCCFGKENEHQEKHRADNNFKRKLAVVSVIAEALQTEISTASRRKPLGHSPWGTSTADLPPVVATAGEAALLHLSENSPSGKERWGLPADGAVRPLGSVLKRPLSRGSCCDSGVCRVSMSTQK